MRDSGTLARRMNASTALALGVLALAILSFTVANAIYLSHTLERTLRGYSHTLSKAALATPDPETWGHIAGRHEVALLVETPGMKRAFDSTGAPISEQSFEDRGIETLRIEISGDAGERVVVLWNLLKFMSGHWPLLAGHLLLLAVVISITYGFQRSQLRPLQSLRSGVEAVARGDFETRVPVVRQDEIGQVAAAFNHMTRQVERMMADRERLLADVSHELRSPLTRIHVALELMPENDKKESIERDLREMENLIKVLLERQRLRSQVDRMTTEPVDLKDAARQVIATFDGRAPGIVLAAAGDRLEVEADRALIRLLLRNLIDNAVKFSRPGDRPVEVALEPSGETVALRVTDDGPGIPEADRLRVFEPFVKLDPARGHRTGYGLGLSLCQRIVDAHRGSIRMLPGTSGGTRVEVTLPRTLPDGHQAGPARSRTAARNSSRGTGFWKE